jgi:hypothetical protein
VKAARSPCRAGVAAIWQPDRFARHPRIAQPPGQDRQSHGHILSRRKVAHAVMSNGVAAVSRVRRPPRCGDVAGGVMTGSRNLATPGGVVRAHGAALGGSIDVVARLGDRTWKVV